MAIRRHSTQPKAQDFAMAPMVDMVFLLLVFFMCVSALSGGRTRHPVDLPQTNAAATAVHDRAASAHKASAYIVLSLDGSGSLSVDGQPCERAALPAKLRQLKGQASGALHVRIRADAATPYRDVESLLAACARAGITRIAYAAHPDKLTPVRVNAGAGR